MIFVKMAFLWKERKRKEHKLCIIISELINQILQTGMNAKQSSNKQTSGSPKRDTQRSLKSKSNNSDSQQSNKVIDIMRLVSRKQHSRQSMINYNAYSYNVRQGQRVARHSQHANNFRLSNFSVNQEEEKYSTFANRAARQNMNALEQSFLSSNESSGTIGILIYILFVLFILVEVVATAYLIPFSNQHNSFYFQNALLTILLSELVYYILLRYFSSKSKKKLFLYKSARASYDKLMQLSKTNKLQLQQSGFTGLLLTRPYLLLVTIVGTVVMCQILYTQLATQVIFLFQQKNEGCMISTIFWSNFALPYLFSNFYLNRSIQDHNSKVKLFFILISAYCLGSLFENVIYSLLMIFNIVHTYIQSKKEFDTYHINQIIKLILLCIAVVWIAIKYMYLTHYSLFNQQVATFIGTLFLHVIILSISMFLTRIIAIKYMKQQLYRHFFTETGINLAFVAATFLINLIYLDSYHRQSAQMMIAILINLVFLTILGVIIHQQGKDKMLLVIGSDPIQQQNY